MKRNTILKVIAILFIPAMVYLIFNFNAIMAGLASLNPNSIFVVSIVLITAFPFLWYLGKWIQLKLDWKIHSSMTQMTKTKKALKPEVRYKNARECINFHRQTDPHLMANDGREMIIIRHEPSPSREDAIQWDMFVFTTTEEHTNWNPITGLDGVSPDKLFYVFVNSMTGESYLMRFDDHLKAQEYFRHLWQSGVKKVEASEFEKRALTGFFEEKGKLAAHKDEDKEKESERNE